ncbi:hypothetical protein MuYL_1562 [Mucilaginibacter xinganensis]|uniref:Uncharacterized protein n=1 Tax=Mucilaginibacter xinganensis TaxID=1234841 RepID=A0A223NUM9_9SPHI|nr:hypothetical protein MuYL_1562 [Mucilaginibacter xinganensis]
MTSKWIDNEVFQSFNITKEFSIQVKINGNVSIFYTPADRDIDGIKEEIRYLTQEIYFKI